MESMKSLKENYRKYKWFFTSGGKLVIGGKNAEQNEFVLSSLKKEGKEFFIMHTAEPGSPFSVILSPIKKISKNELIECADFTASFSQAWKKGKSEALVDIFRLSQLYKNRSMKLGTWGVSGKVERIKGSLELALTKQKGMLRAVPLLSVKNKKSIILVIVPGKTDKITFLSSLSKDKGLDKEQLLSSLPSGGIRIKNE